MLIIIDKRIPQQSKDILKTYGELLELETTGITYDAISGHPDIFFCQAPDNTLIVAPNLPEYYFKVLFNHNIPFIKGELEVGNKYPSTAHYNIVLTDKYLIHNTKYTDRKILDLNKDKTIINTKQAYTRCNLINLGDNSFITSDDGIFKTLSNLKFNILNVSPFYIDLPSFEHGFFGGVCGVYDEKVFINGSLNYHRQGKQIVDFISALGYSIIELYEGKLYDGGSMLFID